MRRVLSFILAAIMVMGIAGPVMAEDSSAAPGSQAPALSAPATATPTAAEEAAVVNDGSQVTVANDNAEEKSMKQYARIKNSFYKELYRLRWEGAKLRLEMTKNSVVIKGLVKRARVTKNQAALTLVKQYASKSKRLHADLAVLWEVQKQNWSNLKSATKARDKAKIETACQQILATRKLINAKIKEITVAQKELIKAMTEALKGKTTPVTPQPQPQGNTQDTQSNPGTNNGQGTQNNDNTQGNQNSQGTDASQNNQGNGNGQGSQSGSQSQTPAQ